MAEVRVDIKSGRSYDIHIGSGVLAGLFDRLPFDVAGRTVFIISDENVAEPHAQSLYSRLEQAGAAQVSLLVLPPGEGQKSIAGLERVLSWMLDNGLNRQAVLFAVGGGVIGDLGGFAASVAMRGIDFVQVPTTLLAQVDSAVGGKTGINMKQGKNLAGTFYQPRAVFCDFETLQTLPERQVRAGYAEIVKYGLIDDPEFFIWLEKEGREVCRLLETALTKAVETSCSKKASIVARDEREGRAGLRALLNLGHTFGHALETACGYDSARLLHGEAVAIGMVLAFRLSARLALCPESDADRVEAHLQDIGLPTKISMIQPALDIDPAALADLMKHDKKASGGKINFILAHGIGKAFITADVPRADIEAVLSHSLQGR